jgi:Ni/Co efflux regulator RcnB
MLKAFAATAALALAAGVPAMAQAQDEAQQEAPSPNDVGSTYQPDTPSAPQVQNWNDGPRIEPPQDRGGRDGRGESGGRRDRGGDGDGGRRDRGDDGSWNRGSVDIGGGWATPVPPPPVIEQPGQNPGGGWNRDGQDDVGGNDGQNWDRGNERRDREAFLNGDGREYAPSQDEPQRVAPRGSFADSCSGSYVNQGRLYADCRDTRGNVRGTSIELARCSSSDIGNDNGRLVCHNVRGDIENRGGNNDRWDRDRYNDGGRHWYRGRSNDWWRNDRRFRGYTGYRYGYYFAPNHGYYSVPRNYFGQRWGVGDFLPSVFWRYRLDDYRTYGLGYPPRGTRWVAVDNTVYLIDNFDGYIIDAIYNAWRW